MVEAASHKPNPPRKVPGHGTRNLSGFSQPDRFKMKKAATSLRHKKQPQQQTTNNKQQTVEPLEHSPVRAGQKSVNRAKATH